MKTYLKNRISNVYIFRDFAVVLPSFAEKDISDEYVLDFIDIGRASHIQLLSRPNKHSNFLYFLGYSLYKTEPNGDNPKDKIEVWTKPGKTPPPMYREIVLAAALKM